MNTHTAHELYREFCAWRVGVARNTGKTLAQVRRDGPTFDQWLNDHPPARPFYALPPALHDLIRSRWEEVEDAAYGSARLSVEEVERLAPWLLPAVRRANPPARAWHPINVDGFAIHLRPDVKDPTAVVFNA